MRNKKRALLFFVPLLLVVAAAITLTSAQNGLSSKEADAPTIVQEGVLTEKQRKHSKIFKKFDEVSRGRKLRDLVAEKGNIEVVQELGDVLAPYNLNTQEYLDLITCLADSVLIGTVKNKSSQIIEEGTFLFTDYEVQAQQVLKSANQLNPNATITVTRPGGSIILHGHRVRAIDHREEALGVGGEYLFYLRSVPETGSYRALGRSSLEDTFEITGTKVKHTSKKPMPLGRKQTVESTAFIAQARSAVMSPCTQK